MVLRPYLIWCQKTVIWAIIDLRDVYYNVNIKNYF